MFSELKLQTEAGHCSLGRNLCAFPGPTLLLNARRVCLESSWAPGGKAVWALFCERTRQSPRRWEPRAGCCPPRSPLSVTVSGTQGPGEGPDQQLHSREHEKKQRWVLSFQATGKLQDSPLSRCRCVKKT